MHAITAKTTPTQDAWERCQAAAQAQRAGVLTGGDRLDSSRSRLASAHARLNESGERVGRGRERRNDPELR